MNHQLTEELQNKRVLVTGGRGFIGSVIVRKLCAAGAQVHTVGRSSAAQAGDGQAHVLDLQDQAATEALIAQLQPHVIVHMASHVTGARTEDVVLSTLHSNLTSTVNLLSAAKQHNCERVVLCGSLEEPDPSLEWQIPSSPYAASKLAASAYGRMYSSLFDLDVVNLRVYMVYGPGQSDLSKLIPYTIRSIAAGEQMSFSSGVRQVDWIYVDDVADAFVQACVVADVGGKTIDVGTGVTASVREVVELIHELMDAAEQPEFGGTQDRPMEQVRVADVEGAYADLAWRPAHTLLEGMRKTIPWYAES